MSYIRHIAGLIIFCLLCGCASPAIRYHTLTGPGAADHPAVPSLLAPLEILPVGVPVSLDRSQIIVREGTDRVYILNDDQWLSPLSDEIREPLETRLQAPVSVNPAKAALPAQRLWLQVRRFDARPGQNVSLEADWQLLTREGADRERLSCHSSLTLPVQGGIEPLFPAWQQLISQLARQIADTANTPAPVRHCPGGSPGGAFPEATGGYPALPER